MILQQDSRLCCREGRHVDLSIVCSLHQGRCKPWPKINNQKRRGANNCISQSLNELFACRVDPMQVFDDNNRSDILSSRTRQCPYKIKQQRFSCFWVELNCCL